MHLFLSLYWLTLFTAVPAPQPPEICELQGMVYVESVAGFADYRVYVEEVEAFSQMLVFREENPAFATGVGHWAFTENRIEADFTIYWETVPSFADFAIFYTDFPTAAGCR